ncbi:hypothetical protein MPTK1_3g23140 [Marchantia polymorpha subsp. ruderalis]|uniref:Uncharacterized protein n=2 Tax=Marchantia polymorpha TaxID=3197 RepID=A0AAF6B3V2_MARPO|nr:hypothetical protein MARPO_0024s0091 [Marchantia polymorpha]BBN06686.1 hypothetical protein Mp_3g23140 [Marchantia polymorpha subsp. ruderalis]|eukprot:PTQ43587.1 hypothetical protein MARPO_0024s0091 [Marchantia polymorpha]
MHNFDLLEANKERERPRKDLEGIFKLSPGAWTTNERARSKDKERSKERKEGEPNWPANATSDCSPALQSPIYLSVCLHASLPGTLDRRARRIVRESMNPFLCCPSANSRLAHEATLAA